MSAQETNANAAEVCVFLSFQSNRCQLICVQSQDTGANELVKAVDQLLNDLGPKFSKLSTELFERSKRIIRLKGAPTTVLT